MVAQRTRRHPEIILGTTNPAKAALLAWLIEGLGLRSRIPEDAEGPPETGATLAENASLKAQHWSRRGGGLAIASDGGLQIPALDDRWDPLLTHRFAGDEATEEKRARALLTLMAELRGEERRAFFVEAVALAQDGTPLRIWEAEGDQALVLESMPERLIPGFWAGSLLVYPRSSMGRAELGPEEPRGDSLAWARLQPQVRRYLREWLAAHRP